MGYWANLVVLTAVGFIGWLTGFTHGTVPLSRSEPVPYLGLIVLAVAGAAVLCPPRHCSQRPFIRAARKLASEEDWSRLRELLRRIREQPHREEEITQ